ncbi:hypothetical protein BELL_0760g00070 [Botrytis elliptica]|uniref:Extracellular membrane protein CFEM domain-containing protein n=1 Tax=Botrytis elliptica TaxID=278938 RepID=A0A4Z1JE78_9HELO|nr:hypothetical protein BELL_0760g00070 [Botrytis elliptica]
MQTPTLLTISLLFLSNALSVTATPPACLLAAINVQSDPSDLKALCGTLEHAVTGNITDRCSGDKYKEAVSSYQATCFEGAGVNIRRAQDRREERPASSVDPAWGVRQEHERRRNIMKREIRTITSSSASATGTNTASISGSGSASASASATATGSGAKATGTASATGSSASATGSTTGASAATATGAAGALVVPGFLGVVGLVGAVLF